MSDLKWNGLKKFKQRRMLLFLHYLKSWGRGQWSRRFLFFFFFSFFSVGLKGQDSVKLNFIHTVSLAAWLKCSHGFIQLPIISQHLHSTLSSTLTLNLPPMPPLWNIPALFKPPTPTPYLSTYYWRIKLNLCRLSNPSSALHSCVALGWLLIVISLFCMHIQGTNTYPRGWLQD